MITATFTDNEASVTVKDMVWQYDYGQVLQIEGLTADDVTELDFATSRTADRAEIHDAEKISDTAMRVDVPDEMLVNGDMRKNYDIYVWVFVHHDGEGETTHQITIPVLTRPARLKEEEDGEG